MTSIAIGHDLDAPAPAPRQRAHRMLMAVLIGNALEF